MNTTTKLFETLRQPEYTGKHRCKPCTWVNSAIAVMLSVAVTVLVGIYASLNLAVATGGTVLFLSAGTIYFRGYFVPKTPELTSKYFPPWLLEKFGKTTYHPIDDVEIEDDPIGKLEAAGVLEECPNVDDLCMTESFRRRLYDRYDEVSAQENEAAIIADHLDIDEAEVDVKGHLDISPADEDELEDLDLDEQDVEDDGVAPKLNIEEGDPSDDETDYVVVVNNQGVPWPSREALITQIAAAHVLEDDWEQWSSFETEVKSQFLRGLRMFLDSCPSCGSDLAQSIEDDEESCGPDRVVVLTCETCESPIASLPAPEAEEAQ